MCNQVPKLSLGAKMIIFPAAFITCSAAGILLGYGRTKLLQWLDKRDESERQKVAIEALLAKYDDKEQVIREALRAKYGSKAKVRREFLRAKYGDMH